MRLQWYCHCMRNDDVSLAEAAAYLSVDQSTVWRWVQARPPKLPGARKRDGVWRVSREALDAYLASQESDEDRARREAVTAQELSREAVRERARLQNEISAELEAAAKAMAAYTSPKDVSPEARYTLPEWAAVLGPVLDAARRWHIEYEAARRFADGLTDRAARRSTAARVSWKETAPQQGVEIRERTELMN